MNRLLTRCPSLFFLGVAVAIALPVALKASDTTRDLQAELKSRGFYFGEVTGTESAETTAAIRRFQIRNGLSVTGKADTTTLEALGIGVPAKPPQANPAPVSPTPAPALKPETSEKPPKSQPAPEPVPTRRVSPVEPAETISGERVYRGRLPGESMVDPPTAIPNAADGSSLAGLFYGTPYWDAPRELQVRTLVRVQQILRGAGYYAGISDGILGPETEEALLRYQSARGLDRTGRLDMQTLSRMDLLPRGVIPSQAPFRLPSGVYRGTVVR
jgi:peptidoglycan hydrolase-like protein with peptidoglycan-binding domain